MDAVAIALILAASGAASGFMAGLLGIGGGILLVPALFWVLHGLNISDWPMHVAVATSLANIVFTGVRSAWAHHQRGNVDRQVVLRYAPPIVLGTILGIITAAQISSLLLQIIFAVMTILLSTSLLLKPIVLRQGLPQHSITFPLVTGFGLISSLMGIGGGSLVVPSLIAFGYPMIRAIGSAAALGVCIAIPAVIGFATIGGDLSLPAYSLGFIWLPGLLLTGITSVWAAPWGTRAASALPTSILRRIFAGFLALVGIKLIYNALHTLGFI